MEWNIIRVADEFYWMKFKFIDKKNVEGEIFVCDFLLKYKIKVDHIERFDFSHRITWLLLLISLDGFGSKTNEYDPYSSLVHFGNKELLNFFAFLRDGILKFRINFIRIGLFKQNRLSKCFLSILDEIWTCSNLFIHTSE